MNTLSEGRKCYFFEKCPYALTSCMDEAVKGCHQYEIMAGNLNSAKTLACPEYPGVKCDIPQIRALLPSIQKCTLEGKCLFRQMPEFSAFEFNPEFSPQPQSPPELKGMELGMRLKQLHS